jgi:tetratricopeptide (TPR) repeat protein
MSKPQTMGPPERNKHLAPASQFWLRHPAVVSVLLVVVTLSLYWPVVGHGFLTLDDPAYYTANPQVQAGLTMRGMLWSLQAGYAFNWHPLTWLSHMLDAELFGKNPAGPHLVNLLFHCANTVLLFGLLRKLTGAHWRSAMVAALFALHPLHVESVAWVAERKDLLSTFFALLCLQAYSGYCQAKAIRNSDLDSRNQLRISDSRFFYWLALLLFSLGLMSKPMLVTLPFLMLLLDYWPLRRFQHPALLVWEKVPFFVLAAGSCILTIQAQAKALQPLTAYSGLMRLENALVAYASYLGKSFWPANLALPYPHPGHWPATQVWFGVLVLMGLCGTAVWQGRRRPCVASGVCWFLGLLVPVIGLVQVGEQAMADRYIYLPQTGLFLALVWGAAEAAARRRAARTAVALVAGLALVACAWRTRDQLAYWADSRGLFSHAIAVTEPNAPAHYCLGIYFDDRGHQAEAIEEYRQAIQINPRYALARLDLGAALARQQEFAEAGQQFAEALRLAPENAMVHNNLAAALAAQGQFEPALEHYQQALRLAPDYADAHRNLGKLLLVQGRYDEAIQHYREALRLAPEARACNNLGYALAAKGQTAEAMGCYRQALRLEPNQPEAHNNLGNALLHAGQLEEAIAHYCQVLRLNPNDQSALNNLGFALAARKQYPEAAAAFEAALRAEPAFTPARLNLADVLAAQQRLSEAAEQCQEVLHREPDNPKAHFCLGRVLLRLGQTNNAVAQITESLRLQPDYKEAAQLLNRLTRAGEPDK